MAFSILLSAAIGEPQPGAEAPHGLDILPVAALFVVLTVLSILLPRLRKAEPRVVEAESVPDGPTDEEVLAAVCAIHANFLQLDQLEHTHMTWRMYEKPYRPWRLAGRAEFLLGKQSVHNRARNRSR